MFSPFSHSTRIAPLFRVGWVGEFFLALLESIEHAARIQEKLMSHMKDCTCRSCLIKTRTEEKVFPVRETKKENLKRFGLPNFRLFVNVELCSYQTPYLL